MKCLLQRVSQASVTVDGRVCGKIGRGLLVFVGIEPGDDVAVLGKMLKRILDYRVFADSRGRMNLSLRDVAGGLLLVSQFTLAAQTDKGLRPGFSTAAAPEQAAGLFAAMVELARQEHAEVACGEFAADMQVSLVNDGPVTFLLQG